MTPSELATFTAYRTGATAAKLMPAAIASGLAGPIGAGASFANPERRAMIARHLNRVDPRLRGLRLRRAVQDAFDWYARYWMESFRLPSISTRTVDANFQHRGYQHIVDARNNGTGVILALPHLGGWEWAGRWIADQGHPITVVVEHVDPPELFEWFVDLRSQLGMNVVALDQNAGSTVLQALKDNHVVCLLADRDLQRKGPQVEFFGETTRLPGGPGMLALRTDAPVLPTAVYFTNRFDGHLGHVRPALGAKRKAKRLRDDVDRVTQDLAREFEYLIRRAPSQWHLFQPNWPSDPGYEE